MADFTSLEALFTSLQQDINESLVKDVAPVVEETMQAEVQNTVYSVYQPKMYDRRLNDGGLLDMGNYHSKLIEDGTVAITNDTPINEIYGGDDSMSLTEQIIEGKGYIYGDGTEPYAQPRDFMEAAREDLRQTNAHVEALKAGLSKRGYEIK
jgi:hypothetical protein